MNSGIINKNPDKYDHIYVIGDIHGQHKRLTSLLDKIPLSQNDLIVFLGDYIDRGKHSLHVIRTIWDLEKSYDTVALRGNHEEMCIEYLLKYGFEEFNHYDTWMMNGGKVTYKELAALRNKSLRQAYVEWIARRPLVLRLGDSIIAAHAGFNAFGADFEQELEAVNGDIESIRFEILWSRAEFLKYYNGKEKWYVGHTPVQAVSSINPCINDSTKPIFLENNIVMMDTGSFYKEGSISCINIKDNTIYQSED